MDHVFVMMGGLAVIALCVCININEFMIVCNLASVAYLALNDGDSVEMSISGSWAYFYTSVDNNPSSMTYSLVDDIIGDCDMYLRLDDFPSKSHHDYSDSGWDSYSHITVDHPDQGLWILGIYNFLSCDFTLTFSMENEGLYTERGAF